MFENHWVCTYQNASGCFYLKKMVNFTRSSLTITIPYKGSVNGIFEGMSSVEKRDGGEDG
jgi:hypothetical protein